MLSKYFKDLETSIKYDSKFVNGPVHAAWFLEHVSEFVTAINEVITTHFSNASIATSAQISHSAGTVDSSNNDIRSIKKLLSQKVLPNLYFSALMALKKNAADARSLTEIGKSLGTSGNVKNLPGMFRLITENKNTLTNTNNIIHSFYEHPMCSNKEEMVIFHEDVEVFDPVSGLGTSYPVYREEVLVHIFIQMAGDAELESRFRSAFKPVNDDTFSGREYTLHTTTVDTFDNLFPTKNAKVKAAHIGTDEFYFPYTESAKKELSTSGIDLRSGTDAFFVCMDLDLHTELDRFKLKQVEHANAVFIPLSTARKLFPDQEFTIMPQVVSKPDAAYLSCYKLKVTTVANELKIGALASNTTKVSSIQLDFDSDLAVKLGIKRKFKQIILVRGLDRLDPKYSLLFRSKYFFELPVISTLMKKNDNEKTLKKELDTLINSVAELSPHAFKVSSMIPNYFGDIGFKNSGVMNNLDVTLYNVNETYQNIDLSAIADGGKLLTFMSSIFNNDPSAKFGRSTMAKANMRVLEENFEAAVIQDISAYTMEGPLALYFNRKHVIKKNNYRKTSSEIIIPTQMAKTVNKDLKFKAQQYANWVNPIAIEGSIYLPLGITGVTTDGNGFVKAVKVEGNITIKRLLQDNVVTKEAQDHDFSFSINGYLADVVGTHIEGKTYLEANATPKNELSLKDVFVGVSKDFKFQTGELDYNELQHMVINEREAVSNFYDSEEGRAKVIVVNVQFNRVRKDIRSYEQEDCLNYRKVAGTRTEKGNLQFDTAQLIKKWSNEVVMRNAVKCSIEDAPQDFSVIHLDSNIFGVLNVLKPTVNLLTLVEDYHYLFLTDAEIDQIANLRHANRVVFKPQTVLDTLETTAKNIQSRFETLYGKDTDMIDLIVNNVEILNSQNMLTRVIIQELTTEISQYDALEKVYILYCLGKISKDKALALTNGNASNLTGGGTAKTPTEDGNITILGADSQNAKVDITETLETEETEADGMNEGDHVNKTEDQHPVSNLTDGTSEELDSLSEDDQEVLDDTVEAKKGILDDIIAVVSGSGKDAKDDKPPKTKTKAKAKDNKGNNK